jgi:hypothetical protein
MFENTVLECVNIDANVEVTTLEYGSCLIEIRRRVNNDKVNYDAFADFRGDEEKAYLFDHEMYNVNNIYSDSGALSGEDDHIHLQCPYNPRDIIENYLGFPQSVRLEIRT